MLPNVVAKVVEIAVGVAVGNMASDAVDKAIEGIKKVVKAKKAGA